MKGTDTSKQTNMGRNSVEVVLQHTCLAVSGNWEESLEWRERYTNGIWGNSLVICHFVLLLHLSYKRLLSLYTVITVILLTPWCFICSAAAQASSCGLLSKGSLGVILNSPSEVLPWPYMEHFETRIPFLFIEVDSPIYSVWQCYFFFFFLPFFSEVFLTALGLCYFAGLSLVAGNTGLVALGHVESSQTRDWTHVSWIGRQILIHCITWKLLRSFFFFFNFSFSFICPANVNTPSSSFFKLVLDLSIAFCSQSHLLGPRPEYIKPHNLLFGHNQILFSHIKIGEIALEAALSLYFLPQQPITVASHLSIAYKPYLPSCQAFHKLC